MESQQRRSTLVTELSESVKQAVGLKGEPLVQKIADSLKRSVQGGRRLVDAKGLTKALEDLGVRRFSPGEVKRVFEEIDTEGIGKMTIEKVAQAIGKEGPAMTLAMTQALKHKQIER